MSCISKQEQIDRVLTHVERYKKTYDEWFEYYRPLNLSLTSTNLGGNISVPGYETTVEFEGLQKTFFNLLQTTSNIIGKNYYSVAAGYTYSNGPALSSTGRQTSIELHPEFFKLKVRSLTAFWVNNNIGEWRVPLNLSANNDTLPALQITQTGLGDSFRVNDQASDTTPFVITNAGNVGIGTSAPESMLHLKTTGPAEIILEADTDNVTETDNARIVFKQDGSLVTSKVGYESGGNIFEIATNDNITSGIVFKTAEVSRMFVNNNGNIGINTNDPDIYGRLTINGSVFLSGDTSPYESVKVDSANRTNTYITFGPAGSVNDWAYLRQIGGSNSYHMTLDFHDDANAGLAGQAFSIRSINSVPTPDQTPLTRVHIDGDGNVGVNTNSPNKRLTVVGSISATDALYGRIVPNIRQGVLSSYLNITSTIPFDNTIPTNTEGANVTGLEAEIVPSSNTSQILVEVVINYACIGGGPRCIFALFREGQSNAIATCFSSVQSISYLAGNAVIKYIDSPNSTQTAIYKVRAGVNSGASLSINGDQDGQLFGGTMRSTITLTEIVND